MACNSGRRNTRARASRLRSLPKERARAGRAWRDQTFRQAAPNAKQTRQKEHVGDVGAAMHRK
eukprot:6832091-Pyramimonas_sp.AAC.1